MYIQGTHDILNGQNIVGKQRCVPGVVISICIQCTRDILNGHSIKLVNSDVYLGSSSQYVSRVHEIY